MEDSYYSLSSVLHPPSSTLYLLPSACAGGLLLRRAVALSRRAFGGCPGRFSRRAVRFAGFGRARGAPIGLRAGRGAIGLGSFRRFSRAARSRLCVRGARHILSHLGEIVHQVIAFGVAVAAIERPAEFTTALH